MRRVVFYAFLAVILNGCGSYTGMKARGSSSIIHEEELRGCHATNLYDAINLLRPHLMNKMYRKIESQSNLNEFTVGGADDIVIYYNGGKSAGIQRLRSISIHDVARVEYLEPTDATMRFGTGHSSGALLIESL